MKLTSIPEKMQRNASGNSCWNKEEEKGGAAEEEKNQEEYVEEGEMAVGVSLFFI